MVPKLIESGIISKENATYFIELLSSKYEYIKKVITNVIPKLIECEIFDEEELMRYDEGL
jgi:hypothetical protein